MLFDVIVKSVKKNQNGKDMYEIFRCPGFKLSSLLRKAQDDGYYIFSVTAVRKDDIDKGESPYSPTGRGNGLKIRQV